MQKRKHQNQSDKSSNKNQHTSEYLKKEVASLYSSLGLASEESDHKRKQLDNKK